MHWTLCVGVSSRLVRASSAHVGGGFLLCACKWPPFVVLCCGCAVLCCALGRPPASSMGEREQKIRPIIMSRQVYLSNRNLAHWLSMPTQWPSEKGRCCSSAQWAMLDDERWGLFCVCVRPVLLGREFIFHNTTQHNTTSTTRTTISQSLSSKRDFQF